MKLLLSSLLLASLCALSSWSVPSGVVVTQTPDVSVMEGEEVNITCCWTGEVNRKTVNWLKNQTKIKSEGFGSLQKGSPDCINLTLMNITREESGRYICTVTVEIPVLSVFEGNGTVVTVTVRDSNTTQGNTAEGQGHADANPPFLRIILAVVAPSLLITLVSFCTLQRRQARAARVIYEVPHIDSEEAEMDKHSTSSSRGSSQWCQVAVYESFDYFERVETKESN